VGPFFSIGFGWCTGAAIADPEVDGDRVVISGRVLDGDRAPVADALLEIWQADALGRFGPPGFRGFGRVATDAAGAFRIATIRPGGVDGQAPHLVISLFARGLLCRLLTRMYFPGDALAADPVLARVPEARRATLIARQGAGGSLAWDVVLQGEGETVFFEV
jgi:protocatechuate 3,4-dioxygenase alpha subunit